MHKDIPRLKGRVNSEKISVAVDAEMKKELDELKWKNRVNVSEWIRQIIRKELKTIHNKI